MSWLWAWASFHLIFWTLLPLVCNTSLPLDCVEAVMWGSEWEWGYDKHPPLSAWVAEFFAELMGDAGIYLASQLCVVGAGIGIFKLARLLKLSVAQSVCAVLLLECVHFYHYSSVEFNVNILQLPFWAWGWYWAMDALENKRMRSWIGLGLCVGLGALTKYIAVFMLIPLFAAWLLRGQFWQALKTPGLWIAGVVSMLVFLPHLIWMHANDWVTITYGLRRAGSEETVWWQHFWFPLEYILSNVTVLLPLVILAILARRKGAKDSKTPSGALGLVFGAYAFMVLLSLVMAMQPVSMWAIPLPLAIGLCLVPQFNLQQFPKLVMPVVVFMGLLAVVAYSIVYGLGPRIREKPHRVNYPGPVIAAEVEAAWHTAHGSELPYVIASEWLGGIVNHYGADSASVMIRGVLKRSAYLSEETVQREGAVVLWLKARNAEDAKQKSLDSVFPDLRQRYPQLIEQEDLVIPWPRRTDDKAGRYGLALISPES